MDRENLDGNAELAKPLLVSETLGVGLPSEWHALGLTVEADHESAYS